MEAFTLDNTYNRPLAFTGVLLAESSNKRTYNNGGRWSNYSLYRTKAGKLIGHVEHVTCWQGEKNRAYCRVLEDTQDDIVDFFGLGEAAKDIYCQANIDISQTIE